ncbi:MAG: tetratricopeptide repeat protein [Isosphaeraceae bacterium]
MADGLSAYLNGVQERLQSAERERAVAVVREPEQRQKRKVQLALAASVMGLILGGGAFAFWRAEQAQAGREREARNGEAVAALLGQAEEALKADDAAKAAVALEAARKRADEGGAEKEAARLGRLDADLALLRDLDSIDQFRWTVAESRLPDAAVVATRTREALKRFGADPDAASVEEAAARVSASVVRERIVSALDRLLLPMRLVDLDQLQGPERNWYTPRVLADVAALAPKVAGVRALLWRVDADPSYRDAVRDAIVAGDRARFLELAGRPAALEQPPGFVAFLGESVAVPAERRRQLLRMAVGRRPGDLGLLMTLGNTYLSDQKTEAEEQLRWYQAALATAPANVTVYSNLGAMLCRLGQWDEAIACCRKAIELEPRYSAAHNNLGLALYQKGQLDEAIACCRKAIELEPKSAWAHSNLGVALHLKGQVDEAIACCRKAIEFDPKIASIHNDLGFALAGKGQVDEAITCYRKAIELDPKLALAYHNLGFAFSQKGQVDEAIACCRKAIELDPKLAPAHNGLGIVLKYKGQTDEAMECYRKAIELDPKYGMAYSNLGNALTAKGLWDEAIACHKAAIALDPKNANAHNNLADLLKERGDLTGARIAIDEVLQLDPKHAIGRVTLAEILLLSGRFAESVPALEQAIVRLRQATPAEVPLYERLLSRARWLAGQIETTHAPRKAEAGGAGEPTALELAERARAEGRPALAARIAEVVFAASPARANDLRAGYRDRAARDAVLAAAGQGEDAAQLDDAERARLRRQALDWLRADLGLWTRQLESGPPDGRAAALQALRHWQQDTDLAAIRDAEALAKLPEAEREPCEALWAEVGSLLKRAGPPTSKEDRP